MNTFVSSQKKESIPPILAMDVGRNYGYAVWDGKKFWSKGLRFGKYLSLDDRLNFLWEEWSFLAVFFGIKWFCFEWAVCSSWKNVTNDQLEQQFFLIQKFSETYGLCCTSRTSQTWKHVLNKKLGVKKKKVDLLRFLIGAGFKIQTHDESDAIGLLLALFLEE